MAMQALTTLKNLTFSGLVPPTIAWIITKNLARVSIWGTLGSGSIALASFIFNRSLAQEGALKAFVPHVFKASCYSCTAFALVAAYCSNRIVNNRSNSSEIDKKLHARVSLFAKITAPASLIAAAAAWAFSETQASSLIKRGVYPFLGISTAGTVLWRFLNWQNNQLKASNEKK